jgi:dTDP-4-amino-4,6-dideoxygalactose transaminase
MVIKAMKSVPYVNFVAQFEEERESILRITEEVFRKGRFVEGPKITELEEALAAYTGVKEVVALGSGTDALIFALQALGIGAGDEVITAPNSFIATAAAIILLGAKPVFVDVGVDLNIDPALIERAITPRTKAIMPVHMTGRIADMDAVTDIARRHNLVVVEDAAQSFGARYRGHMSGHWGEATCCSAHPLKNLNAAGDAGFLLTNDANIAARTRRWRSHGLINRNESLEWGRNARMDVLQATILLDRLPRLESINARRRKNAELYRTFLKAPQVVVPQCREHEYNIFHTFVVQAERRDELKEYLHTHGVDTVIHYPIPIHLQVAASELGYKRGDFPVTESQSQRILSLPIHPYLSPGDVEYVCEMIGRFYSN